MSTEVSNFCCKRAFRFALESVCIEFVELLIELLNNNRSKNHEKRTKVVLVR